MSAFYEERVLRVHHWTEDLFSFTATRSPAFRFENGQFAMIGLMIDGKPLVRAYSMVSANYEDSLEFFSIKVPNGPLTSRLKDIREGDTLLVGRKATGTLVADNLLPGRTLYLLATGTGLAPFLSIVKDPMIYDRFERIILTHTCRWEREHAYRDYLRETLPQDEILGEMAAEKLTYYPTTTREPSEHTGRITDLIQSGRLFQDIGAAPFDIATDRVMICGGPDMVQETRSILEARGFVEGSGNAPGHYVVEKAFVEK
ncbi:ferredoxin--NADP reductase [Arenibaculum pallidiluteum]|uniref:ferredoxin--NADP reductase n=1 Tax=Arenibaculum pallidiluteum TaxID=2812559 RepID=UPI001A97AB49|nr:ferredoxin--NADP reductase [Arenibaculum pallidiluteum]